MDVSSVEDCFVSLSSTKRIPLPAGVDGDIVEAADKIIAMGDVAVCKTPRSGFTTSSVHYAERSGRKTLVVAPTRRILTDTVRSTIVKAGGTPCDLPGHNLCKYIRELIEEDPLLAELPLIFKDRCDDCEDYDECPITEIERIDEFTTATITYSKLESVMLSSSESSKFIRERLADMNLIILDEAHLLSFPSLPQVDFDKYIAIPDRYHALIKVYKKYRDLVNENRDQARTIEFYTEQDPQHYTGFSVSTGYFPEWHDLSKMWGELINLAKNREDYEKSDDDIRALRDIISIMAGRSATISYLMKKEAGRMVVTGSQSRSYYALMQFLTGVVPNAQVIFVSGTLVERRDGFFSELAGREIKSAIFPDLNDTNTMMNIHPSKWRFSTRDGKDGLDRAIKEVREISESVGHQLIYLLAMNTRHATVLKKELKDLPNIIVDYYKSADSIGVAQEARVCIAVGAAELPRHACDPLAEGNDDIERFYDSQQLRINAVDCATWQSWSRVKDPDGLVESHVYCIGIRAKDVSRIVTWGTKRTVNAELNRRNGIDSSVECEEYLGRPKIVMESRSDLRPSRRKVSDYVDAVVPICDVINARQKTHSIPYYNLLGETVRFLDGPLRLYNRSRSSDEFEQTFFSLVTLFVTRIDKCGLIWRSKFNGKVIIHVGAPIIPFKELLWNHLFDDKTIAQPPFDLDDNCHFCAVDFDDHDGNTPQSENVKKLTGFLKEHEISCVVVKSGSNDGYHVFIPLVPTKTLVAHKFLKQLIKDAGLDGIKEIERYPKQKSIGSSKGRYGNQIRIPLGINWKVNKKSIVVDPYTLERVDFVEITHAIKLRDLPDEYEAAKKKPKKSIKVHNKTENRIAKFAKSDSCKAVKFHPPGEMRPCIRGVIESGVQLEGGEGHTMRVATAVEAHNCGLSEEEAIDLFRMQDDFDEQTTSRNIQYIWEQDYSRYGCEKLQDECGSLVKDYCGKCHSWRGA